MYPHIKKIEKEKDLLIRGGFLYSMGETKSIISDSWILVDNGTIVSFGKTGIDEPETKNILDASAKMVLPGFVNPHWHESFMAPCNESPDDSHVAHSPYCQGGDIEKLSSMFGFISSISDIIPVEIGVPIALWSMWTQLRSGTTALGDVGSANSFIALANAALQIGIRLRVSRWGSDIMIPNGSSKFVRIADAESQANDWEYLLKNWNTHPSQLIGGMPSIMGCFGSSDEQLKLLKSISEQYNCPYAMHLAPLKNEIASLKRVFNKTAVERVDSFGLLSNRMLAVHTAFASKNEYDLLIKNNVNICHSPAHYGILGESTISETKQIGDFIKAGANVSTSTDGNINYIGGMPEAMRACHLNHSESHNDNTICPPNLTLQTATLNGARALGWEESIGSIDRGKKADLVLVDIDDWRYWQSRHPLQVFLLSGSSKDVHTVIVDGKILIKDGNSTQFDEKELFRCYKKSALEARKLLKP